MQKKPLWKQFKAYCESKPMVRRHQGFNTWLKSHRTKAEIISQTEQYGAKPPTPPEIATRTDANGEEIRHGRPKGAERHMMPSLDRRTPPTTQPPPPAQIHDNYSPHYGVYCACEPFAFINEDAVSQ